MAALRQGWLTILVSGLALFYALEKVLVATHNPNFIPSLLLVGAFLVPVTFTAYIAERLPAHNLSLSTQAVCFLWGGAIGTLVAGILEYETLRDLGPFALVGVGVIEEAAKLLVPLAIYLRGRQRGESAGLLVGVTAGMGFAALETMGYGFVALLGSQGSIGALEETLLLRGLMAPAGHAAWTGLVCGVLWQERLRAGRPVVTRPVVGAFAGAVALHTLWDTLASLRGPTVIAGLGVEACSLVVAMVSLTLLVRRVRQVRQRAPLPATS